VDGCSRFFLACYKEDPVSPLASPLIFPTGHKSLPPTYFQICGMDPLRDDSFIYERILREECAVKTRVDLYPGLPHGFWSWFPEATFSKKQLKDSMEGMAWLLESK
jgi:acetyl esterase/lipase